MQIIFSSIPATRRKNLANAFNKTHHTGYFGPFLNGMVAFLNPFEVAAQLGPHTT